MKYEFAAFDDKELNPWLLDLIEEPSASFFGALAEAALTASPEEYRLIRPSLLQLKRKSRRDLKKTYVSRRKPASDRTGGAATHSPQRSEIL